MGNVLIQGKELGGRTIPQEILSSQGTLITSSIELAAASGRLPGFFLTHVFGQHDEVSATVKELVWDGPTAEQYLPDVASAVTVVSTDAADDTLGIGAQQLNIRGLDFDGAEIVQIIQMQGIAPVILPTHMLRVTRAWVSRVGSAGGNVGIIMLTQDGNVVGCIPPGVNIASAAAYTVPANSTGYLTDFTATLAKKQAGIAVFDLQVRLQGAGWVTLSTISLNSLGIGTHQHTYPGPLVIPALADVRIIVLSDKPGTSVAAEMNLIIEANG